MFRGTCLEIKLQPKSVGRAPLNRQLRGTDHEDMSAMSVCLQAIRSRHVSEERREALAGYVHTAHWSTERCYGPFRRPSSRHVPLVFVISSAHMNIHGGPS